mmetsp:Transcript_106/g.259  ORF Transcript_106/g.259 Transcript_106/m.259 type:complete len:208 (+) Transcript_106:33-656(+)
MMAPRSTGLALVLMAVAANAAASEGFQVEFTVQLKRGQTDTFVVEVHPEWAPLAAARFGELIDQNFYDGCRFFRVISGFMAQFGIHGNPKISAEWRDNKIKDDPVKHSNEPYTMTFATSGKDSRTTQLFINFVDNSRLDGMDFAPFAKVISGTDVVDQINAKHGETPAQGRIQSEGNRYLKREFPNLSYIVKARRVVADAGAEGAEL